MCHFCYKIKNTHDTLSNVKLLHAIFSHAILIGRVLLFVRVYSLMYTLTNNTKTDRNSMADTAMPSESLAVFALVLILEHGQVALVAARSYIVFIKSLQHGASWLVGMGAVVEAAVA